MAAESESAGAQTAVSAATDEPGNRPQPTRPTISLPPRPAFGFSSSEVSPGPLTLLSSFFADDPHCPSFSQLLAGAITSSPAAMASAPTFQGFPSSTGDAGATASVPAGELDQGLGTGHSTAPKQSHPLGMLMLSSPMFTVPPGISPTGLLDSPNYFTSAQELLQVHIYRM